MALAHSLTPLARTPKLLPSLLLFAPRATSLKSRFVHAPISKSSFFSLSLSAQNPKPFFRPHRNPPIRCLFTGIVEEMGQVKQLGEVDDGFVMKIGAKTVLEGVSLGDSIAINGTCLTVTEFDAAEFTVGLSPETLRKTSLIELEAGSMVNLERAVQPTSRMGGHFVQGHVDGTGEIVSMEPEGDSLWVKVRTKKELLRYVVPKGFIAIDGTSLTVVDVFDEEDCFNFMLVAYTQQKVVIPMKRVGQKVNLEVDILGKYVERLLSSGFVDSMKSS
ncbi:riboflavin synthase [Rhodamnia argentea]|uniref:Riboflavin synthase n=1 Tax=Rhodamnia argentea TaxID=178133 RepID=A0A8B8QSQ8_9MYRT|nr:riboflavin synthase [Rhodamnia argentea]XP_030549333.1 riboflavin synthase [Rhodamnia argentea]